MSAGLRVGYKQTEVGVIPEDWEVACVGDAFVICNNLRLPISSAFREQMLGDYAYYGPTSIQGWINEYRVEGEYALIGEDGDHFLKWRTKPMTLLVRGRFNVNNHAHLVLGSSNLTSWFYWYFVNRDITASLTRQGASRYKLKKATLLQLPCVIPPLPEQRAITEALSDADALIESLAQLITKKRDLKQATMQQLLTGQTRLPGFSGEWEALQVGEIADVKTGPFGSSLHESDYVQDGTPIITVEHLGEFGVTRQNLPLVSDEDCKRLSSYSLEIGDIVFSRVGSVDRNALIRKEEEGWLFSGRLLRVRPDKKRVFAPYLSFQFHTEEFKNAVIAVAVGQTMASLNTKILRNLSVAVPSLPEQTAIATILSDMDTELAELEARLAKARQIKQGMMQELLTGRIRLL